MMGKSSILLMFCVISGSLAKPPPTFLEYKDSLGQYSFGYSAPGSARSEVRSIDGSTRGSYSYVDGSGMIQSAQYTADGKNGFQVIATNLPQAPRPVEDTPEVVAARIDHLKALEAASKLAEETPQVDNEEQRSSVDIGKSMNSVIVDNAAEIKDTMDTQTEAKNAQSSETMAGKSPTESQNTKSSEAIEATANGAPVESHAKIMPILEIPGQESSNEPEAKSPAISTRSDVPVVTTSFVIPGSVNLHTRIELDQSSGLAAERISPEYSPHFVAQPSISQDATFNPSSATPAGTRMMTLSDSKKAEILDEMSSLPVATMESMVSIDKPQEYSSAFLPGVIAPTNVFALAYGIDIDPIYRQYNPYQYFHYGVL